MSNKYCQCPNIGEVEAHRFQEYDAIKEWPFVNHAPGECKCANELRLYRRGTETLMLLANKGIIMPDEWNNPTPADPRDILDRDTVLLNWQQAKDVLEAAKATEMDWRKYVVKRAFPSPTEGTNTLSLGNGYELKGVIKYSYKLDKDTAKVWSVQNRIGALGNRGAFLADKFFSWKVDFLTTEYKKLLDEKDTSVEAKQILEVINEVLTIEDAAPELKIKEPKKGNK